MLRARTTIPPNECYMTDSEQVGDPAGDGARSRPQWSPPRESGDTEHYKTSEQMYDRLVRQINNWRTRTTVSNTSNAFSRKAYSARAVKSTMQPCGKAMQFRYIHVQAKTWPQRCKSWTTCLSPHLSRDNHDPWGSSSDRERGSIATRDEADVC
jgi:hypothetical protein